LQKKSTPINGTLARVLPKVISPAPRLDLPRFGPLDPNRWRRQCQFESSKNYSALSKESITKKTTTSPRQRKFYR